MTFFCMKKSYDGGPKSLKTAYVICVQPLIIIRSIRHFLILFRFLQTMNDELDESSKGQMMEIDLPNHIVSI